jgi:predicted transcriptional regulator
MTHLCELLFELSNEDRLRIVQHLRTNRSNVTHLSQRLGFTIQETSRHLSRLSHVGLTTKDADGGYYLTSYGKLVLAQLPSFAFASQRQTYFTDHATDALPPEFLTRLGDLSGSRYVSEVVASFYNVDRIIREAEEYIWQITDQYLLSTMAPTRDALARGVQVWDIEPKTMVTPQDIMDAYLADSSLRALIKQARTQGLLEERMLERIDVYLHMNEREVAILAFPLANGRFDYLGFSSTDERTHAWCHALFSNYWARATNRQRLAEEAHRWLTEHSGALRAFTEIAQGHRVSDEETSQLEQIAVLYDGNITMIGYIVREMLRPTN